MRFTVLPVALVLSMRGSAAASRRTICNATAWLRYSTDQTPRRRATIRWSPYSKARSRAARQSPRRERTHWQSRRLEGQRILRRQARWQVALRRNFRDRGYKRTNRLLWLMIIPKRPNQPMKPTPKPFASRLAPLRYNFSRDCHRPRPWLISSSLDE